MFYFVYVVYLSSMVNGKINKCEQLQQLLCLPLNIVVMLLYLYLNMFLCWAFSFVRFHFQKHKKQNYNASCFFMNTIYVTDGDPYSSVRNEKNGESLVTHLYMDAKDLQDLELLYVKILSEFSEVTILFNKASLLEEGRVNLSPVKLWNEEPSPEVFVLDPTKNATVTSHIDTNIEKLTTFVNFIGIDTNTSPHTLLDLQLSDPRLSTEISNTTRGFKWSVMLDSSLVDFGGMLSLRIVEQLQNGPVLQIHVGKTMYIIPEKPGAPMAPFPPNALALLSLYKHTGQTIATKKPIGALWCYAFGNPAPQTSIVKFTMGGERENLRGRVFNIGQYDSAQVVILRNITSNDEGQYMCEARSGNSVVTEPVYISVT